MHFVSFPWKQQTWLFALFSGRCRLLARARAEARAEVGQASKAGTFSLACANPPARLDPGPLKLASAALTCKPRSWLPLLLHCRPTTPYQCVSGAAGPTGCEHARHRCLHARSYFHAKCSLPLRLVPCALPGPLLSGRWPRPVSASGCSAPPRASTAAAFTRPPMPLASSPGCPLPGASLSSTATLEQYVGRKERPECQSQHCSQMSESLVGANPGALAATRSCMGQLSGFSSSGHHPGTSTQTSWPAVA